MTNAGSAASQAAQGKTVVVESPKARLAAQGGTPVSKTPIPFMSTALTEADIAAANAVLRSGMLRQATKCAELEERFARMSGAKHGITCANGTCALQLAYEALLKPGDDVLVPSWSFIATVSMIVARGCRPIFVDAHPETYQLDVADAARKLTRSTTGIAVTHLYGAPGDIDGVQQLASKHGLRVIYDAAQAHLATFKGRGIGEYGDAVTYSFYATKNLATGEGGMVTCNDDTIAKKMKLLRSHGESDKYLHDSIGYNYRMNDITGAIGCSRLDRLADQTARRRAIAARFDQMIGGIEGLAAPKTTPDGEAVYHLYVARMDTDRFTCTRDEFCNALKAEGVPTAVHYPRPLTRQPAFASYVKDHPPVAERLSRQVFALPIHHDLSDQQVEMVGEALRKVADAFRV